MQGVKSPPSFSPPPLPYLLECCFTSWLRWEETHDWLASLAVIGCLCMEAILGDTVFSIHFIGSVISCVYKIFGSYQFSTVVFWSLTKVRWIAGFTFRELTINGDLPS